MRYLLARVFLLCALSLTLSPSVLHATGCYGDDCLSDPRTYTAPDPFQKCRDFQSRLAYEQQERQRNDPSRLYDPSAQFDPYETQRRPEERSPSFQPNRDRSQSNPSWCSTQGYGNGCR